mmetsp:Transcript_31955/g.31224  ORF Transcript_31955/g.31224 Transcript_31955/m.31224 type:complete len:179 (+) Transcript_31955:206-742(+)
MQDSYDGRGNYMRKYNMGDSNLNTPQIAGLDERRGGLRSRGTKASRNSATFIEKINSQMTMTKHDRRKKTRNAHKMSPTRTAHGEYDYYDEDDESEKIGTKKSLKKRKSSIYDYGEEEEPYSPQRQTLPVSPIGRQIILKTPRRISYMENLKVNEIKMVNASLMHSSSESQAELQRVI